MHLCVHVCMRALAILSSLGEDQTVRVCHCIHLVKIRVKIELSGFAFSSSLGLHWVKIILLGLAMLSSLGEESG